MTDIGDWSFWTCDMLESVTIPNSETNIGERAFLWCESLADIVIPAGVESIGHRAFVFIFSLTNITFLGDAPTIGEMVFGEYSDERNEGLTAYVKCSSTGWGVEIPGTWNGINIAYLEEDETGESGGTNDVVTVSCTVTAVEVKPRWPWNGLVDIDYTPQVEPTNGIAVVSLSGCDTVTRQTLTPTSISGVGAEGEPVPSGTHRIMWDVGTDYPRFHIGQRPLYRHSWLIY